MSEQPGLPQPGDLLHHLIEERHIGAARGVTAARLAGRLDCPERHIRELVTQLRMDGTAICGVPRSGYYIAATADELEETCAFLRSRAMRSLVLESRLRRIPLPDLLGQLTLPS